MIIQCEKCRTKFNVDESLLKNEGSKVRCSLCKYTFVAYPPEQEYLEERETIAFNKEEIENTVVQDSPGVIHEKESEARLEDQAILFDNAFEEPLEDQMDESAVLSDDSHGRVEEEMTGAEQPLEPAPMKKETPKKMPRRPHLLPILLVIVLILIGATAAIFLWVPDLIPDSLSMLKPAKKQEIADMGVRRLSFKSVTGSFVNSENLGNLFVIRGVVTNDYPKSRSFILIKGSILDDKGQVVKRKLAYAGNNFKEEEIKSLPLDKINQAMKNRYGMGRKNVNIASGANIPFTIVFENLPKNLSEFTVEAVSSSPGTK
ncbi:MAG: zinc-ribbon domain-containing protein [Desulfobacteraceae bacterium]|nr:MAG: zinc-ribbon domain-containing protein [Desulfobacteraceae bacterium]